MNNDIFPRNPETLNQLIMFIIYFSGKGVAPFTTPWCSKLSKREPLGHPRLWYYLLLLITVKYKNLYIDTFTTTFFLPGSITVYSYKLLLSHSYRITFKQNLKLILSNIHHVNIDSTFIFFYYIIQTFNFHHQRYKLLIPLTQYYSLSVI